VPVLLFPRRARFKAEGGREMSTVSPELRGVPGTPVLRIIVPVLLFPRRARFKAEGGREMSMVSPEFR
jgi:hypothetical protein